MKKILLLPFLSLLVLIFACGDASNNASNNTQAGDTSDAAAADQSVMSKTGLPLGPDQEVPANNSTANGTADVTYNKQTGTLVYTVNYSGLTEAPTMAHIHGTAPRGTNAGVVHDLTPKLQKEVNGSFTDSVVIEGKLKEDSLLSGFYYFNIHTPQHPGGEIRGQIEF